MSKKFLFVASILVVLSFVLAACGTAAPVATEAPVAEATEAPVAEATEAPVVAAAVDGIQMVEKFVFFKPAVLWIGNVLLLVTSKFQAVISTLSLLYFAPVGVRVPGNADEAKVTFAKPRST